MGHTQEDELEKTLEDENIKFLSFFFGKPTYYKQFVDLVKNDKLIGRVGLFSGSPVVIKVISNQMISIFVLSIFKSTLLWLVLIIFFNNNFKAPLQKLVRQIKSTSAKSPTLITDEVSSLVEYREIKDSFNDHIKELISYKTAVESIINNKTVLIEEKNKRLSELFNQLKDAQKNTIFREKLSSLGVMSAGLAHELKNPLNISLNTSLIIKKELLNHISQKTIPPQEVLSFIELVIDNNQRMSAIVENMLMFVRRDVELRTEINLGRFLNEIVENIKKSIEPKFKNRINIKCHAPSDLMLNVLPQEFARLFINLFENSLNSLISKLNSDPAATGNISLTAERLEDAVQIQFKDNGEGIPQELLHKIFDPFFSTKSDKVSGGLGLFIVYEIIKKHCGSISVSSEQNKYTEFNIVIPNEYK